MLDGFWLERLFYLGLYSVATVGMLLLVWPMFQPALQRRRQWQAIFQNRKANPIDEHLSKLLAVTFNKSGLLPFYYAMTGMIVLIVLVMLFSSVGPVIALIIASALASIPYLFLRLRLHDIRLESSYEAQELVTELIDSYKVNHRNMIAAIDDTAKNLTGAPYTQKALYRLSLQIKKFRGTKELENILQEFNWAIDTQWSQNISNSMFIAIHYGDDITPALEDVLAELKDLKNIQEKNRQMNNESFNMVRYVTPGFFLFSTWSMFQFFGFTFEKYVAYQFQHQLGLTFFTMSILAMIGSWIVYRIARRPKNDF